MRVYCAGNLAKTHENSNVERPNRQSDYRSTYIKDENSREFLPLTPFPPPSRKGWTGELMAAPLGFISKLESGWVQSYENSISNND